MKKMYLVALFATTTVLFAGESLLGQPGPTTHAQPSGPVPVYRAGKDVTAPELIPIDFLNAITTDCEGSVSGDVELTFIVDTSGHTRNIAFVHPIGNDLDKLALVVVGLDRFKPGEQNGAPVAIGQSVKIKLDGCFAQIKDEAGQATKRWRLHSPPIQTIGAYPRSPTTAVLVAAPDSKEVSNADHVGGGVRPPVPIFSPQVEYSAESKKKGKRGVCLISLTVDTQGMPRNLRMIRPLDPSRDQDAMESVQRFRFKPAMKDGIQPVPVKITIEVSF